MERQSHISPDDLVCLMTARLSGCWRHSMNLRQVRPKHQVLSVSHDTRLLVIYCTSNNKNVVSQLNQNFLFLCKTKNVDEKNNSPKKGFSSFRLGKNLLEIFFSWFLYTLCRTLDKQSPGKKSKTLLQI